MYFPKDKVVWQGKILCLLLHLQAKEKMTLRHASRSMSAHTWSQDKVVSTPSISTSVAKESFLFVGSNGHILIGSFRISQDMTVLKDK